MFSNFILFQHHFVNEIINDNHSFSLALALAVVFSFKIQDIKRSKLALFSLGVCVLISSVEARTYMCPQWTPLTHRRWMYVFPRVAIAIIRETILSCCLSIEREKNTNLCAVCTSRFVRCLCVCVANAKVRIKLLLKREKKK